MSPTAKIVLTCLVIGAAVGVGWAASLTWLQPQWQERYANPKRWYSWVFGPLLCTVLAVGHFVEGRPLLGGTFVTLAAVSFFFLLTSAIQASLGSRVR